MIKFFRKIRQDLLSKGKTGKYLKYAIGEIILVVIGILIALQVSNLNENSKNAVIENAILNDLKSELQGNINLLEIIITEHKLSLNASLEIKSIIQTKSRLDKIPIIRLDSILVIMNRNWTFDPKLGILNSTINSGKIDFVQSKDIKYGLSSIKESIIDASESTKRFENLRESFYWALIARNSELSNDESLTLPTKEILRDIQFAWWTKFTIGIRQEGLDEEIELLKYLRDIRNLIESEIKK